VLWATPPRVIIEGMRQRERSERVRAREWTAGARKTKSYDNGHVDGLVWLLEAASRLDFEALHWTG
jgi:hypothetical protein